MNSRAFLPYSGKSESRAFLRAIILSAIATLFVAISGCSSGPAQATVTAPTNLVYPQAAINATTGQAIPSDTPTVGGAAPSFSVSPTLPAGLSLSTTSGVIAGTPTAVATQATYTVTATNSAGTTTATIQITVNAAVVAPTNLAYPQATITANVGQAIATDTPTVTGTVTTYSTTPALPAGLSLNTTTGAISGTPTAVSTQASYIITATNSAGSATATLQITVNAAVTAPSNLSYPQTSINTSVGQPIPADIPTVTGTVTSFSVSPTLPAGLSLNTTSGAITGAGTAASAQATYTVTASNVGGSTTATLTITINKALPTLFDVGHANHINLLRVTPTRVLSQDSSSHWALWDYASNAEIASGDQLTQTGLSTPAPWPVDIAGQIFVIGQTNGLDVRATTDGHLLFQIQSSQIDPSIYVKSWWKLATDGSYICSGSPSGLTVWSAAGQLLFTRQGDYSSVNAFASPGQVLVAGGSAGQSVIETISASSGTSSTGPAFSGTFNSWFLDGQRFLTNTGTTVWVYAAATSTQQSIVSLPTIEHLTGQGNWFWTYQALTLGYPLNIYAVGANTPSASYALGVDTGLVPSGNTLGILPYGSPSASVVDLAGSTPVKTDYPTRIAYDSAYAATSASQWILGNEHGVVLDGSSASTTPRYFGTGQAWSIAGSTNLVAVATANGNISYYSPSSSPTTLIGTINFSSSKIALSSDGSVLAAMANGNDSQYELDRTLKIFSLPSGTLTYSFPSQFNTPSTLFDFSLSGSGTITGQVVGSMGSSPIPYTRQVVPATGGAPVWTDPNTLSQPIPIYLSPDGTLIAAGSGATTNVYKNGLLTTAVNGSAVGWIDNNQLLVNNYTLIRANNVYVNASIDTAAGSLVSNVALPELLTIQPVNSGSIYSPTLNTIFSLPSGSTLYSSSTPVTGPAAVAGSYVVFASGSRIVVDTH
jgi:hypothetical protein